MQLKLGRVFMTQSISCIINYSEPFGTFVWESLGRHQECDFGDCEPEDLESNTRALTSEGRIFSVYYTPTELEVHEPKIWIITEWDRSLTTVLLPRDY